MIDKISLKFGSSPNRPNLEINLTPITVFVGPNNSGKSKVLTEIERYSRSINKKSSDLLVDEIQFTPFTNQEIEQEIIKIEQVPNVKETMDPGYVIIGKLNPQSNQAKRIKVHRSQLIADALQPNSMKHGWFPGFFGMYTLRLDGTNRLGLLQDQSGGDLQTTPVNHLAHLFIDNELRKELRRIVFEAFGKYFVIDPTNIGSLRVRLSDTEPKEESEEKGWGNDAINFHKAASLITEASDGIKAFIGIITTLLAGDPKVTLIDEPEAFLHPALSNKLGKEIGNSLRNTKKRLLVATHSSSFLMGCIQSGSPLNIVRLTYKNGVPTARLLPEDKILHLMRHPLLRSTGVLNGLFYESVIVTEADSDRAFYQEINERLLTTGDSRGISNCLFINAQNKQTVWEIVKPLRELGIPVVGVVDIDVIKEGGQVFAKPLEGAFLPTLNHAALQNQRAAILAKFVSAGKDMKRDGGVDILQGEDKEACNNFFDQLQEYGVFIIRDGELESWQKHLGAISHGPSWLISMFTKMGEKPEDANYVNPSTGDVWDFIGEIKSWIENPNRKGIPD